MAPLVRRGRRKELPIVGRGGRAATVTRPVVLQVASVLLRHPDETLPMLPAVRDAIAGVPEELAGPLTELADHLDGGERLALAQHYSEVFDFTRTCSLYLTYYPYGDTRQRGTAFLRFTTAYKVAGLELQAGELPDYLPLVLEFAACHPEHGARLLTTHRASLDVLHDALVEAGSPYRLAVDAVRRSLPPATARDTAIAARLRADGPPTEDVGMEPALLEPYALDPALLSGSR